MGDPKKHVSKYSGPRHPWEAERLVEEKKLIKEYGLKNKKDIWKQTSFIKKIKNQVKDLNSSVGEHLDLEKDALTRKLVRLNLLNEGQSLEDALELTVKDLMERRLQTQLVRQNLARTVKQARQFIVHGHIKVNGKAITSPSYLVSKEEQFLIEFRDNSNLADEEHPERKLEVQEVPEVVVEETSADESKKEELEVVEEEVAKELETKIDDSEVVAEEIVNEAKTDDKKETKEDSE